MNDHFGGPSVHCGQILQKKSEQSPPPLLWQCQHFWNICSPNSSLAVNIKLQLKHKYKKYKYTLNRNIYTLWTEIQIHFKQKYKHTLNKNTNHRSPNSREPSWAAKQGAGWGAACQVRLMKKIYFYHMMRKTIHIQNYLMYQVCSCPQCPIRRTQPKIWRHWNPVGHYLIQEQPEILPDIWLH